MALFSNIFKKKNKSNTATNKSEKSITLLVIRSGHDGQNFYKLFEKCKLKDGRKVIVEQAAWSAIQLTAYSDNIRPVVNLKPSRKPLPNSPQNRVRCIQPDFLLLRELCRGIGASQDHRNLLYGFMITQTPSINSLHSMYCRNERPLMVAELIRLNRMYGQDKFPIFTQYYYPMHQEMLITPQYPIVLKLGHGDAGFGKIKLDNHKQFQDMKSIVATTPQYCTAENYIEGKCDLRLQKIGDNYQAYKRMNMSGNWKTNTGCAVIEHIEVLPRYKFWMDQCSDAFGGGFDICTVDVLVSLQDEKEYILEFNGTASGFGDQEKDNIILRDYVMTKLNQYFVDGNKALNQTKYMNNNDLVRDIKDEEKYDEDKYITNKENEDMKDNDEEQFNGQQPEKQIEKKADNSDAPQTMANNNINEKPDETVSDD